MFSFIVALVCIVCSAVSVIVRFFLANGLVLSLIISSGNLIVISAVEQPVMKDYRMANTNYTSTDELQTVGVHKCSLHAFVDGR